MLTRRAALLAAVALPLSLSLPAAAADKFTDDALEKAQKAEKPILVEVGAAWCPVCRAQKPILEGLAKNDKFKEFVFFKIDFDTQKAEWRKLSAQRQSTLIVFKGGKEVGRSVGDTNAASIEALLAKAL
jgi:thioredoxin 1